ncbi:MAG: antitoxin [Candidatus Iainarchaeum sp.]|jgi:hypothetical protein|nr:MAG: hypothetical protein BWY55_00565 [archaeon ADurb.Bin336]
MEVISNTQRGNKMVSARVVLNEYSNKVLNVVKAKYSLKDKSEALNKFIHKYGEEEVEKEVNDKYLEKIINIEKNYFKNNNYNHTPLDKLRTEIEEK